MTVHPVDGGVAASLAFLSAAHGIQHTVSSQQWARHTGGGNIQGAHKKAGSSQPGGAQGVAMHADGTAGGETRGMRKTEHRRASPIGMAGTVLLQDRHAYYSTHGRGCSCACLLRRTAGAGVDVHNAGTRERRPRSGHATPGYTIAAQVQSNDPKIQMPGLRRHTHTHTRTLVRRWGHGDGQDQAQDLQIPPVGGRHRRVREFGTVGL